jgi:predicted LPLAT superfamily acyltransferase
MVSLIITIYLKEFMLVTFKSKAAAEVLMYKEHAKRILDLLHKDLERGVLTAAEVGNAIMTLDAEIAENQAHPIVEDAIRDTLLANRSDLDEDNARAATELVSFSTRVYPLLQMLRAAQKEGVGIMWGV